MGEMRNACRILTGKSEGKTPLGSLRHNSGNITVIWSLRKYCGRTFTGFI
jgi:hypothetical protein